MLSLWEKESLTSYDHIIIGAGLLGLHVAFELVEKNPNASIAILERGLIPSGASTKNAGFACFGSLTEIIQDIKLNGPDISLQIVLDRYAGIQLLCDRLGKENIGYLQYGGYELITEKNLYLLAEIDRINAWLFPYFKEAVFEIQNEKIKAFGFDESTVKALIYNKFEGQVDTGKMMKHFLKITQAKGVQVLTGHHVKEVTSLSHIAQVQVENNITKEDLILQTNQVFVCSNAYITQHIPSIKVKPGRGQVLVTKAIADLPFKGVFHFEEGFYYFRNFGDRIVFGGGRQLDFKGEESYLFEYNQSIINSLNKILQETISPNQPVEIDYYWTGIMGFSEHKQPIISKINERVYVAMSCNGMGVALTSISAKKLVQLLD